VEWTKQACRNRETIPLIENLVQDAGFAVRQLRRSPGLTCTAILMLALGVGASVALFAFVDAALIKPLPYENPNRLTFVTEKTQMFPRANLSYPDYLDWKKLNKVFSSLDIYNGTGYLLSTPTG
jgi:macrolide transport system ATP-binding/permease protein